MPHRALKHIQAVQHLIVFGELPHKLAGFTASNCKLTIASPPTFFDRCGSRCAKPCGTCSRPALWLGIDAAGRSYSCRNLLATRMSIRLRAVSKLGGSMTSGQYRLIMHPAAIRFTASQRKLYSIVGVHLELPTRSIRRSRGLSLGISFGARHLPAAQAAFL